MKEKRARGKGRDPVAVATKGDRSRRSIKKAVIRLVSKRPVEEVSLADICRATRLTTGAVYFHFNSKDEAVESAIIDEIAVTYEALAQSITPTVGLREALEKVVRTKSEFHRATGRLAMAVQVVINTRPRAYKAWLDARTPVLERLDAIVTDVRARAGLPREPAGFIAHFLLGAIEDLAMDVYQWGNPRLAAYAGDEEMWIDCQVDLWVAAAMAPISWPRRSGAATGRRAASGG